MVKNPININSEAELAEHAKIYAAAKSYCDKKKELMARIEQAVKAFMGENQMTLFEDHDITVKYNKGKRTQFDTKKFTEDHPRMAKQYAKEVEVTRFSITEK